MIKRTSVDEKRLNEIRVIANFHCGTWRCNDCPLYTQNGEGCASLNANKMLNNFYKGKEVIY